MRKQRIAAMIAAPLVMAAGNGSAAQLSAPDRNFVENAARAGLDEVQDARLAEQKATSTDVKQFASRMMSDHTQANQELMQIAATKGITAPRTATRAEERKMESLRKLSGAQFDRQYAKEQVEDHEKTVALFRKESEAGQDSELKAYAQKYLPKLQQHLQMAESLAGKS
jgi:putative membrane protein